jgi:molybdopterin synthase catalytic subunit/molybdopterin converting factor small subunit
VVGAEVTVLVFGPLREQMGVAEMRVRGSTVREVWEAVVRQHPRAAATSSAVRAARNLSYCDWNSAVESGDTIAFLPPVAGGCSDTVSGVHASVSAEPIEVDAVIAGVGSGRDGAVATFIGRVRDTSEGHAVSHIDYEAYPEMAVSEMRRIGETVYERGGISAIVMVHRVGRVAVSEPGVIVVVAAPHRDAALRACQDVIDLIKRTVPMWKREHRDDGAHWVDARHRAHSETPA